VLTSAWTITGVVLTLVLLGLVPLVWRRWGAITGLHVVAFALLPAAFGMTGLLTLIGRLGRAIGSFATHLVFSPTVWFGFALIGASVLIEALARALRSRGVGTQGGSAAEPARSGPAVGTKPRAVEPARRKPAADDEFADIEEILRRRGIS
jgi:hypothetical protein